MATRRTRSQWQHLITTQQASGLSQKVFCQQQGVALATFGSWKRKLKPADIVKAENGADASIPDSWIELPAVGSSVRVTPGWQIELDLGNGVCLRLTQPG